MCLLCYVSRGGRGGEGFELIIYPIIKNFLKTVRGGGGGGGGGGG